MNRRTPPISVCETLRGWTLVELLVATTLSMLLIAGIGQIYLAAKRSYDIQNSISHLQDIGRYATEVLTQDIRRARYWGLMDMQTAIARTYLSGDASPGPTCTGSNATWGKMVTEGIFGLNDTSGNYQCINRLRGDVLTLRYADPTQTATPYSGNGTYIRTTAFTGQVGTGPAPALTTPAPQTLDYAVAAHAYYVRNSTITVNCGSSSVRIPDLAREYLALNSGYPITEGLVTGVEQLQFQYGVDSNGDGAVDQYLNATSVTANNWWSKVRAVRFWVLVRDDCPDPAYTDSYSYAMGDLTGPGSYTPHDHFHRALYTSTVALRN